MVNVARLLRDLSKQDTEFELDTDSSEHRCSVSSSGPVVQLSRRSDATPRRPTHSHVLTSQDNCDFGSTFLCRESLRPGPDAIPGNLVARAVQTLPHVDPDERGNNESVVSEAYQSMDLHLFAVRYKRSTFTSTPDILSRYPRSDLLWTLRVRQRASVPARACVSQSACSLCTSQYRTSLPTEIPIHQCGAAVGVRSGKISVAAWP